MHRILAVGIATIDIISIVNQYPSPNDKIRATQRYTQRGGNACNTLVVLAQQGVQCSWLGTLANDEFVNTVINDLDRYSINHAAVEYFQEASNPLSCITVDASGGSRTIVHYRNLPELDVEQFKKLDLQNYDWIHFEGRNIVQTALMLEIIANSDNKPVVSVELEKSHQGLSVLIPYADVVMFSRDYVLSQNFTTASEFLKARYVPDSNKTMFCAWGDKGAWGIDQEGLCYSPAVSVPLVDTTGAGDVFNAGVIENLLDRKDLQTCLNAACELASRKCAQQGFDLVPSSY